MPHRIPNLGFASIAHNLLDTRRLLGPVAGWGPRPAVALILPDSEFVQLPQYLAWVNMLAMLLELKSVWDASKEQDKWPR